MNMDTTRFADIRPYAEAEIAPAMRRIADSELFPLLASYVFPDRKIDDVREHIRSITTTARFQHEVMSKVNEQVIKRSMTDFTYNGIDNLDRDARYLFVSNHRDIMLDSSLLQYILHINGHETTEITFGANLMSHPLVIDIGKSNKMFRVERGGNIREFYHASLLNSEYIRHTISEKRQSVWIAQRNGRTKDGMDRTEPGLVRMFASSMPGDKIRALSELNIVPVSISYEWETCDILKTLELYASRFGKYVKRPGEDLNSILTGIVADKGHVHIEICNPLNIDELLVFEGLTNQEYFKAVARIIDRRINASYHIHPTNYIAYDMRYGMTKYSDRYTSDQRQAFCDRLESLSCYSDYEPDVLMDIFLGIYANPINSRLDALT